MKKLTQKKLFKVKNIAENTKKSIWWKSNQQGFFSIKPTKPTLWSIAKKIVNNKQTKNFEAQSNFVKQDNKKKKINYQEKGIFFVSPINLSILWIFRKNWKPNSNTNNNNKVTKGKTHKTCQQQQQQLAERNKNCSFFMTTSSINNKTNKSNNIIHKTPHYFAVAAQRK